MADATNKVASLKDALITELLDQIENGPVVVDKESGEPLRVSPGSSLLAVAAKVVKDFAHEADSDRETLAKAEKLQSYLERRKGLKVV